MTGFCEVCNADFADARADQANWRLRPIADIRHQLINVRIAFPALKSLVL